ncbi:MAG: urea amidolyase family protein [Micropruina sp.]|uniref:5-oxoprolinase subunit B/C family protein n=1 Tax=Micropruina sp. TaxID=2737536 RepID=UPI0039E5E9CD
MDGRLLPCGERAVLIEVADLQAVLALQATLAGLAGRGDFAAVTDVVPAATTVLLMLADPAALPRVRTAVTAVLAGLDGAPTTADTAEPVEIDVVYDGEDLDEVARLTGLSAAEAIAAHTGSDWRVAFGGFAPGFSYLTGGDPRLEVPRRAEPRTTVPAGAVGLAGPFSGIYPRPSPGGWQLIGRTGAALWDADREPPALLQPGARVRFRAIDGPTADTSGLDRSVVERVETTLVRGLEVLATGPLLLIVDEGRPGYAAMGVGRSGAADRIAYRLGGRLVGNPAGLAALEITFGGLRLRARTTCLVALTGADCAATVDGRAVTHAGPVYLRTGQELRLGTPRTGLRTYLSVAGGFDLPVVLGSASTDMLSGVGPALPNVGDLLPTGAPPATPPGLDSAPRTPATDAEILLDVLPGPRADWLADPGALGSQGWQVSERSDRVGVRLTGDPLHRHPSKAGRELPSEPMVRGSIQVPPEGRPVIFGVDGPVTGGYPVVGVLTEASCDAVAQARPGDRIRFRSSGSRRIP